MHKPQFTNTSRVLTAQGLSYANVGLQYVPLLMVRQLHLSLAGAMQLLYIGLLIDVALQVPSGWVADHYLGRNSRRNALALGAICSAAGMAFMATATHSWWLIMGGIITKIGLALASGVDLALVAKVRASFMWSVNCTTAFQVAGGLIAGLVVLTAGIRCAMWVQVGIYLAMLVPAFGIKTSSQAQPRKQNFGHVAWSLRRQPHLLSLVVTAAATSSLVGLAFFCAPLFYARVRWGGAQLPSWGYGYYWAICMASPLVIGKVRSRMTTKIGNYGALIVAVIVGAGCLLAMGSAASIWGLILVLGIVFGSKLQVPFLLKEVAIRSEQAKKGDDLATIMSLLVMVELAIIGVLLWVTSSVERAYGLPVALRCTGCLFAALAGTALAITMRTRPRQTTRG